MFQKKAASRSAYKDGAKDTGSQDNVKLPSLFGLRPGVYLTIIYSFVIVVILFFLLVFPGMARRGSVVTFTSEPSGAAVRVDDVFFDTTPCDLFVEEGPRRFDIVMPGFDNFSVEVAAGAGGFASLFFPRRLSVHAELKERAPLAALTLGVNDAAAWSFTGESAAAYQTPLSLSEGVYRSAPRGGEADELLKAAARFTSSRAFLKDLLRAKLLADNEGRSPSPLKMVSSVSKILVFMSENPAFTVSVANLLEETAKPLLESAWYKKNIIDEVFPPQTDGSLQTQDPPSARFGGNLLVAGVQFVEVEGGIFKAAADFSFEVPVPRYYIAANEVSDSEWSDFLHENPEWGTENAAQLAEGGFVDQLYLVKNDSNPVPAVQGVSWFAAEAYCRWLTSKLGAAFSGWTARLPTEIEWEYAAKSAAKGLDGGRLKNMVPENDDTRTASTSAGLWEWCADPFVPLYFLRADSASIETVGSPKRSVRGGCWINPAGTVTPETRGGLPPYSCSPFVSFRPVIAREMAVP
ncbi:MAG: SUMF1/EgtB/PvdO family nonheme iron enzyme [Spirochaetaceae bacterium]|jgi:formylglycine-generating enzyme required for sulfatase activity|nr:SUMF1/EgtB/PvdO family nonheme iron enzyme [Spirochaetaceae bacterium]